ncbi:MAG: hypothetical protein ACLSHC_11770 [Bilophila wadsworthia]
MLHKYKMLPLVAVMLVMSLVFRHRPRLWFPTSSRWSSPPVGPVVNISTEKSHAAGRYAFRNVPRASEFERFFEQFEGNSRNAKPRTQRSSVPASHLRRLHRDQQPCGCWRGYRSRQPSGQHRQGAFLKAQVIGTDEETDIALLKVKADAPCRS